MCGHRRGEVGRPGPTAISDLPDASVPALWKIDAMTIVWFVIWLVANTIGDHEPLLFDPPNWWTATLLAAIALDLNRQEALKRRTK
jgi:hypothetical protein